MATRIEVGTRRYEVPDRVFLDASFIIDVRASSSPRHLSALVMFKQLLQAASDGKTALFISPLVLDEVWWGLGRVLYENTKGKRTWGDPLTDKKQAFITHAGPLRETTTLLLHNRCITVVDVTRREIPAALDHVTGDATPFLLPRDALHSATMANNGIAGVATSDQDFYDVPSLVVLEPQRV